MLRADSIFIKQNVCRDYIITCSKQSINTDDAFSFGTSADITSGAGAGINLGAAIITGAGPDINTDSETRIVLDHSIINDSVDISMPLIVTGSVKETIKVAVAHTFALSRATNTPTNLPDSTRAGTALPRAQKPASSQDITLSKIPWTTPCLSSSLNQGKA